MLLELETVYRQQGILATSFSCAHQAKCRLNCDGFSEAKSAFVSTGYASGRVPRILFLSLDPGSTDEHSVPEDRLPLAVQRYEENGRDFKSLHKGRHWYRTHELAYHLLRRYIPNLTIEGVRAYFAHANSAKCNMGKAQNAKANSILFRNCLQYLPNEIAVLTPDVLITQGAEAKKAVETISIVGKELGSAVKVVMLSGREVLWIHTFHPRNFGQFSRQMDVQNGSPMGWERLANLVYDWIAESGNAHPAASHPVLKEVAHPRPGCKNTSVNSGATIKFPVEEREMTAIEMLQKLMVAQVKAHHALGAAIEELALWAENNGGSDAASNVRDALSGLDESSALIGDCLELIGKE